MEGKIQYSKEFIQVLKNTENEIGKKLISLYDKDIDSNYNYIDISKQDDSATFISGVKSNQIIGQDSLIYKIENTSGRLSASIENQHIYDNLGFERPDTVVRLAVGINGNILGETVGQNGDIYVLFQSLDGLKTILNKKALTPTSDIVDKLWSTNRNPVKIGRLAQSLLTAAGQTFTQVDIEKFVNSYKAIIKMMNDELSHFDIVSGEDIIEWYRSENYKSNFGTLGNSCMASCDNYLSIYAEDPNIRMVILYDQDGKIVNGKYKSDKIIGRALLWKLGAKSSIGPYFMDRIYTNNDSDVNLFIKFADQMGYWHKLKQNSGSDFVAVLRSETKNMPYLEVSIDVHPTTFPYVDTLCYFDFNSLKLHTDENSYDTGHSYRLNSTGGGYEVNNEVDEVDEDYY